MSINKASKKIIKKIKPSQDLLEKLPRLKEKRKKEKEEKKSEKKLTWDV